MSTQSGAPQSRAGRHAAGARAVVRRVAAYDVDTLHAALPDDLFALIRPGDTVALKPNWVREAHEDRPQEWEQVITHPALVTAVVRKVLARLGPGGRIIVTDGPITDASFRRLMARYPTELWGRLAAEQGVALEIVDLRDHEWETKDGIVVRRHGLPGDPRGKCTLDLPGEASEFHGHRKSRRGYYGADYDIAETNRAHDGVRNLYSVSRSVLEADVFINLPKLKTHKKAGITCCLKNLVGINTYKNFLPHHSEGGPAEGGDQFPADNVNARVEGPLMALLKQHVLGTPWVARLLRPLKGVGRRVFGDTRRVVRSGNWHGNDTLWRMILDLNKVLLYGSPDGTLRSDAPASRKRYIGIVDAVVAGEGQGPLAPDAVPMGYVVVGTNPVAIDAVCAGLMGFDWRRVPAIERAFAVRRFPLCDFGPEDVRAVTDDATYGLDHLPASLVVPCKPHFGWTGHLERRGEGS